jgi:DNA replication protein DnaC
MSVTVALRAEMIALLKELKMPTVRECYEDEANRARAETLSYERYLLELARREAETRRVNRIERMLRQSHLPLDKTLATFDLDRLPLRVQQQIAILREGAFLDNRENILAFGNPGSGKTHLLAALGNELIQQGRRVLFCHCALLVQELLLAKEELKLPRLLKRLEKFEALIIDDIGYVEQNRDEMEVLFTLLAERYERGSVLLTSNLPFSQWERIFKDPMTTAAAIDRLVHHSVILELNVDSYRMEHAKSKTPQTDREAVRRSRAKKKKPSKTTQRTRQ